MPLYLPLLSFSTIKIEHVILLRGNRGSQCKIICQWFFSSIFYIKTSTQTFIVFRPTFLSCKEDILIGNIPLFWHFEFFNNFNFLQLLFYLMEFISKSYSLTLGKKANFKIVYNIGFLLSNVIILSIY